MADTTRSQKTARAVLDRCGRTYSDDAGIDLSKNTPAPLFQWLTTCVLLSARIRAGNAIQAAQALNTTWKTAGALKDTTWKQRVKLLNANGYARFDESTASMLADVVDHALDAYGGDLRKLREAAGGDAAQASRLLQKFKGIGPAGAAIFLREVQSVWDEFYPFADDAALAAAQSIGLPKTSKGLANTVPKSDFPRLLAGLIRARLADDLDAVRAAA